MRFFFISLLVLLIIACSMLSYKIETFDTNSVGTVIDDNVNPPNLDMYNCYDYVKNKLGWNVDAYGKGEKKVLATLRTGINSTYQTKSSEPHYTQACILPKEHAFIYNFEGDPEKINIPGKKNDHILSLDNGSDTPSGYKIDLYQPNQDTQIPYSNEGNFRDLLSGAYALMESKYQREIASLCNQIFVNPGHSNIFVEYSQKVIPTTSAKLKKAVQEFKPICIPESTERGFFDRMCSGGEMENVEIYCCNPENDVSRLQAEIDSIQCKVNYNTSSINKMKEIMDMIRRSRIDDLIKDASTPKEVCMDINGLFEFTEWSHTPGVNVGAVTVSINIANGVGNVKAHVNGHNYPIQGGIDGQKNRYGLNNQAVFGTYDGSRIVWDYGVHKAIWYRKSPHVQTAVCMDINGVFEFTDWQHAPGVNTGSVIVNIDTNTGVGTATASINGQKYPIKGGAGANNRYNFNNGEVIGVFTGDRIVWDYGGGKVATWYRKAPTLQQLNPASGSFVRSCRNCGGNVNHQQGFITCECQRRNGSWISSSHNSLRSCRLVNNAPQLLNDDGVLRCE